MKRETKKTITETEYFCDDCKKEIDYNVSVQCAFCGNDLCDDCLKNIYIDDVYNTKSTCKSCYKIIEKANAKITKYEEQRDDLIKAIKKENGRV